MNLQLADLSFEGWIAYVFDHPVTEPEWYRDPDCDWWDEGEDPATTVAYLTQAFEDAAAALAPFSDAQLAQGLWFLADPSCSDHMFAPRAPSVPWPVRERALRAMFALFAGLFLPRCDSQHLSHLDRGTGARGKTLDGVCYMWWDLVP